MTIRDSGKNRITIQDLADEVGLSVCTINKALYGKPRIKEETRRRVLEAADRLGYHPNRIAQALARATLNIGVVYPVTWQSYYLPLVDGMKAGLEELRDHNITATYIQVSKSEDASHSARTTSAAVRELAASGVDGIILCPAYEYQDAELASVLSELAIPVVFLGQEVPDVPKLTTVRQDAYRSGRVAAELLGLAAGAGDVAVFVGTRGGPDHRLKTEGFYAEAKERNLNIVGVYETLDDPSIAYPITSRVFQDYPNVRGIYIATDNSEGTCKYLIGKNMCGSVKVVATGVFPEIKALFQKGVIQFSLYQNMAQQGKQAIRLIYNYFAERIIPEQEVLVPPVIVTKNLYDLW